MATPEEEKKKQEEINKLLEQENKILREKLRLQSESFDLSSGLVDALKETLGIRSKQTTFESTLLNINKDINKAILNQKGGLSDIGAIQKQIIKNEETLGKAKLTQISLERSIGEEGKKKTKTVFDLFKAQQDLQAELQAELDKVEKGLEINQGLVESTQKQIALNDKSIQQEASKLSSLEQQYTFNQLNVNELEKQNTERQKEKEYQDNLNKSMGVTGALASGLDKTLSKLGLSGLSQRLGINEALGKTKDFTKEITAGSNGVATMGQKFQIAGNLASNIGANLMKSLGPLAILGEFLGAIMSADKATGDLAKGFNITYNEASNLRQELNTIANSSGDIAVTTKGLQESMVAVGNALGTNAMLNEKDLVTFTKLREQAGYTNEELIGIQQLSLVNGKTLEDNTKEILGGAQAYAAQNKFAINEKEVLREVSKTSAAIKLTLGGSAEAIAKAVVQAKQFGLNLQQAEQISNSLLQFEDSISNEIQAELLLGKQFNFERARSLALQGDIAGAAAEVAKQVGTAAQFGKMNVIQQEALAKSVGMTREDLAKSLMDKEALAKLGGQEGTAQQRYNELRAQGLSQAQIAAKLGDKALADQFEQQNIQEKFNTSIEKMKEIFITVADSLMPIINTFSGILDIVGLMFKPLGAIVGVIQSLGTPLKVILGLLTGIGAAALLMSGALTFGVGIAVILAAVGAGMSMFEAQKAKAQKADDMISPGYGQRTILSPEGSIALNDKDTIIAGTNLMNETKTSSAPSSVNIDMQPLIAEIRALREAINSRPINVEVELDGNKISTGLSTGTTSFKI